MASLILKLVTNDYGYISFSLYPVHVTFSLFLLVILMLFLENPEMTYLVCDTFFR